MNQNELLMLWCKQYIDKKLADFTPPEQEPAPSSPIPFDEIYPVGSIYLSVSDTDPASLFGGTWQRIKDCFLLAAGDSYSAGATGGEAEHTLTVEEMPEHTHDMKLTSGAVQSGTSYSRISSTGTMNGGLLSDVGGSQPHNNMPPYLAVYVWQRTA